MALMQDALGSLVEKGTPISPEEHTAALAAALLHDVGHGPFSHSLEHVLITDFEHEEMSRVLLLQLDEAFGGALGLAIRMFDGTYERPFFHQLVSSQLDMDRLDYLRRDSAYTAVDEGRVGVQRIIKTLRVHPLEGGPDADIVVESKGMYAVENFINARRMMYWQVYLHKTVLAADHLLQAAFRRVRRHLQRMQEETDAASPALLFFLSHDVSGEDIGRPEVYETFCRLDDADVLYSLKRWCGASDPVLADLARRFIHRRFFRVHFLEEPASAEQVDRWRGEVAEWLCREKLALPQEADDDAAFYLMTDRSRHATYQTAEDTILILDRQDQLRELSSMTEAGAVGAHLEPVVKPYVCYPKEVELSDLPVT